MFGFLSGLFSRDIGIDLGSANTVVYVKGRGVSIDEPSVLAVKKQRPKDPHEIIAYGHAAKRMIGKTPVGIDTIRPMAHGVIADYLMTEQMIEHYIVHANRGRRIFSHPRVAICVPADATEVEKNSVRDATREAGAREALVIPEPIAAAIGIGLPIDEPGGNMIVDIGGGTSEAAVLSLHGIASKGAIRIAGDDIDSAIVSMMRGQPHALSIGDITAEEIKIAIGSVVPLETELVMEVKGRDLMDGLPKVVRLHSEEVREAIEPIIVQIENTIRETIEITAADLVSDIVERGVVLTGGSSLLRGFDKRLAAAINVPVHMAERPLYSVADGLGKIVEDSGIWGRMARGADAREG